MKIEVRQKVTLAILAEGHNLPTNWAGELLKHSTDAESLVVKIEKKNQKVLDYCFFVGDIIMREVYACLDKIIRP